MGYYASGYGTFVLRLKDDDVFDGVGLNLLTREQVEEVIRDHFEDTDIYDVSPPGTSSSPQTPWSISFGGKYFGDSSTCCPTWATRWSSSRATSQVRTTTAGEP